MKYYDQKHNRLVFIARRASEDFWDEHWGMVDATILYKRRVPPFNFVVNMTRKFLPTKSLILEGGAGVAQNSWYLYLAGYKTIALDFAPKTVEFLRQHRPEVCPVLGDVRNLSLEDESVDGYWSLGVIEHFYDGYDEILNEMHRVIRKDGYLFLTFPHISKLRQIKARKGLYEIWQGNGDLVADFYQFALDGHRVTEAFEGSEFKLIHKHSVDGVKGFKDEMKFGRNYMQAIYDGKGLKTRLAKRLLDMLLRPWASHMALFVFKKQADGST